MTPKRDPAARSLRERDQDSKRVYRETHDPRKAILEWCRGNKWAMENARAVGNLPRAKGEE